MRHFVPGIGAGPEFTGLIGLFQFAGDTDIVQRSDKEFLRFDDVLPQFVRLQNIFSCLTRLTQAYIVETEASVGQSEVRIEFDGPLEEWDAFDQALFL